MLFHLNGTTQFDQNNAILTKQNQNKRGRPEDALSGLFIFFIISLPESFSNGYFLKAFNVLSLHQIWKHLHAISGLTSGVVLYGRLMP